jgi:hypothetical protein
MFILFFASATVEALQYTQFLWSFRKMLAAVSLALIAGFTGLAATIQPIYICLPLLYLLMYRVLNIYRIYEGNSHSERLRTTARLSYICLAGTQLVFLLMSVVLTNSRTDLSGVGIAYAVALFLVTTGVMLLYTTASSRKRMQLPEIDKNFVSRDLPTLTVAIPARNETDDLEACLQSLVKSTYPKLEILVLDDCSQNKRTPEIIRQFAHDGVRFIAGDAPEEEWLAKNYAYFRLAREANGELLMFCGVDARFETHTIKTMVESMLVSNKDMMSLMPINALPDTAIRSLLLQPIRYAWEVSLPRNWRKRPPTLSTCWIISKDALGHLGGFASVRRTILPERYFARQLQQENRYGFYAASAETGLLCKKQYIEQRDTAIRMRYPQMYKRLEVVALFTLCSLLVALAPFVLFVLAIVWQDWLLAVGTVAAAVLQVMWFSRIAWLAYRQELQIRSLAVHLALLYDLYILHISFWRYEFSEVIWKDRNICIPVMQVYPTLPKLK